MESKLSKLCLQWLYIAGVLILLLIGLTVVNTAAFGLDKIARMYGENVAALPGYEDLVRLLVSCIALMFFPWAQAQRGHVAVDFFAEHFSLGIQKKLDLFWLFCTLIVVVFLAIAMCFGILESYHSGTVTTTLEWSEWPFYIPGILSLILWSVVLFFQIFFHKGEKLNG